MKRYELTDLEIERVDLVDKGANQHAHVLLYKRHASAIHGVVERGVEILRTYVPHTLRKSEPIDAEIATAAQQRVAKGLSKTLPQAIDDVLTTNPALAARYAVASAERGRARGDDRPLLPVAEAAVVADAIAKAVESTALGSVYATADDWVASGRASTREQAIGLMSVSMDPQVRALVDAASAADARVDSILTRMHWRLQAMEKDQRVQHLRQLIAQSPGFVTELLDALEHRIGADF